MLILIVVLLSIIPAIAIVYPFFSKHRAKELMEDEGSPRAVLLNRWDTALVENALGPKFRRQLIIL